jgi:osmoprotectant transport system permease protein
MRRCTVPSSSAATSSASSAARRWLLAVAALAACGAEAQSPVVGSKRFTESYILGELIARTAGGRHQPGLGNTGIVFSALKAGSIDVYPEYTGTIAREILRLEGRPGLAELDRALAPLGLGAGVPLGFNNSYALAMRQDRAQALGVRAISDLARHPDLKLGFSQEFIGRADGWPGLKAAYRLPHGLPSGLDHGLAYEALAAGQIDVMDVYSTDAKIARYRLRVLHDDRSFFPRYDAVLLYRLDARQRFPAAFEALQRLEGRIDEAQMIRMNAAAELEGRTFAEAAALLGDTPAPRAARRSFLGALFGPDFWRVTREHLILVCASLAASVAAGIPLGVAAAKRPRAGRLILGAVAAIQTIPSIALFAFLIALLDTIGTAPALVALFLYALLPIVRNTCTALAHTGKGLVQAGMALGLSPLQLLLRVELPLALPAILAGAKTSAVINVGTATIAAFIGAGGYGERIATGLALNDNAVLLAGAVPAAALALLVQGAFELGERRFAWMTRARDG